MNSFVLTIHLVSFAERFKYKTILDSPPHVGMCEYRKITKFHLQIVGIGLCQEMVGDPHSIMYMMNERKTYNTERLATIM